MASQQDIDLAFQRSGIGRGATQSDYQLYGSNPFFSDAGRVEGDLRAGGGGRTFQQASNPDPVETAKKLNEFTVQQNQPAIAALQASKQPLKDRYDNLLQQIKGNQQIAENRQTVATSSELGRRGIQGGGLYDQTLTDALNPITQQFTGMYKDSQAGENSDLAGIDTQIASLQAGNPQGAVQSALQYNSLQQQAQQNAAQLALAQQQQNFAQKYIPIPGIGIYDTSKNSLVGGFSQTGLSPSGYSVVGQY